MIFWRNRGIKIMSALIVIFLLGFFQKNFGFFLSTFQFHSELMCSSFTHFFGQQIKIKVTNMMKK